MDGWSFGVKFGTIVAGVFATSFGSLQAQTIERNTTITGPRGRSVERQVEIQRTPGGIERELKITRPGGTFERQVQIQRIPGPGGFRPGPMFRGGWGPPGPVILAQPAPFVGLGLVGAPMLNFSFGGGGMMGPVAPVPPVAPAPPPDQVAIETQRLQSFYSGTRKEAAYALGRLHDPRATPSLINALKHDYFKDVRVASAIALGEIGGSDAAVALERAAIYDHKDDVKRAARTALERLNARTTAAAAAARAARPLARVPAPRPAPPPSTPGGSPFTPESARRAFGVPPAQSIGEPAAAAPAQDETPPPPPTPVGPGAR